MPRVIRALLVLLSCSGARAADVSRIDLANAYLRFDRALASHPPEGPRLGEIGRDFDRATLAFFAGKNADALRTINEQTLRLLTGDHVTDEQRAAASLHVDVEPATWAVTMGRAPLVRYFPLYPPAEGPAAPGGLRLALAPTDPPSAAPTIEVDLPWSSEATAERPARADILDVGRLQPGAYELRLQDEAGLSLFMGRFRVVRRPLDGVRAANAARLEKIKAHGGELAEALAICQSRNELLADVPDEKRSAQFLADPETLVPQLRGEIEELEQGRDPYRRRVGDYWRTLTAGTSRIALRVYAPRAVCGEEPAPVVVALHGAGGDENMFFDAYGAGLLKRLADEHGFLAAAPSTYAFGGKPENLATLLDSLGRHYAIDRQRVYLVGHSMGAGAAAALARGAPEAVAAACCLAGGGTFGRDDKPSPLLVIAAENDQVIPADRLQRGFEKAVELGMPVEFRVAPGHGHTTVVGARLPEGVAWLLARRQER